MSSFDLTRALARTGKALPAHPAFMDSSTPVATYQPGAGRQRSVLSQRNAAHHSQAYGGTEAIDWVYDCVNLYADPASTADYQLLSPDGTKMVRSRTSGTPKEYEVGPKALYDLLDRPNPYMLYDELVALLVIDLMLIGNAYWYKWRTNAAGQPLALYRLAPSHVKVRPGPFGVDGYEYQPPGAKDKLVLGPSDVVHFRRPNPHSNYYGLGVIQGGGRAMDLELAITDTQASYFENRADPSLIIQSDRRVPRDVFRKLYAQLRMRTAGTSKAGEMLLLENGLKASSLSANAQSAMFDVLSRMSRDRIFTKFRASPMLLGIMDESSGSNKVSDVRREFDTAVLKPYFKKLSTAISVGVAEAFDCQFAINYRSILAVEDQLKVAESIAVVPYIKVREVRRQYAEFGIEESTGDPAIDERLLNEPTPNADAQGMVTLADGTRVRSDAVGADNPIGSEAGRPPNPENTVSGGQGKALDVTERIAESLRRLEAKAVSTPAPDNRLPNEVRPPDPFATARRSDIDAVTASLQRDLADAAATLERSLLDHVEGKALKTSDLVARVRNSAAWGQFREALRAAMVERLQSASSSAVMHSGLTPSEDVDYEEIANVVIDRKGGVRDIVQTLKDRVVKRVKAAREANSERHEFNAAIQGVIAEWSAGQAAVIADTEATHAYNEATLRAAELSGATEVYVEDGDDYDEPCQAANGAVWSIDYARENRLEHPNCRRAFLPVLATEVS